MQTFTIKVTEHLTNTFEVEAENKQEALEKFENDYFNHSNDYYLELDDTDIEIV